MLNAWNAKYPWRVYNVLRWLPVLLSSHSTIRTSKQFRSFAHTMSTATQVNNKAKVQPAGAVSVPAAVKAAKATPPPAEQGRRKKKKQKVENATVPSKVASVAEIKTPPVVNVRSATVIFGSYLILEKVAKPGAKKQPPAVAPQSALPTPKTSPVAARQPIQEELKDKEPTSYPSPSVSMFLYL